MLGRMLARCAIGLLAAAAMFSQPAEARSWDETYFPNYVVYDQDGKSYRFYDDLIRGKIVVANFVYTTCTDICGLATARMAEVVEGIGDKMNKDIFVYSVTLTPEIDTPEVMKNFISAFGEVEGWKFLTGDPAELQEIRWKLGERSRYLGEHRSDMVMGNDNKGYWRRISLMGNLQNVTREILALVPRAPGEARPRVARLGDQRVHAVSTRPGEALYNKGCSGCHTIGRGDTVGPDLYGVTWKRDPAWLMRVLTEPEKLRREGDPLFTELDAKYPYVMMPYLDLSETDAADVMSYIEYRSAKERTRRGEPVEDKNHGHAGHGDHAAHDHTAHDHTAHDHTAHDHTAHDHTAHDHSDGGHGKSHGRKERHDD